ncbi:MAG: Mth938-like domain-containing protein [Methylophilaceae bacterium]|nr:Mth938-like domain-containing protein [Methylophilaceae bacterium]
MKLHLSNAEQLPLITAYGEGFIIVQQRRYTEPIIISAKALHAWAFAGWEGLSGANLTALVADSTDIVLLGSGQYHRFAPPALSVQFAQAGMALEVMSTPAACRTYNILLAEGRRVSAFLVVDSLSKDKL